MGFWDFFKRKKKLTEDDIPSEEQSAFAEAVMDKIATTIIAHGFKLNTKEIKKYSTNIVFRKAKQYIKIDSTTYPTDYPFYYNVILGEGSSDDFFEYDWNSVAIWQIAKIMNPSSQVISYDFPTGDKVKKSVEEANKHLEEYGDTFLRGDLTLFYEARKKVNEGREPYKIYTPGKDGSYIVNEEAKSAEQKKKYS